MVWGFAQGLANPHSDLQLHIPSTLPEKLSESVRGAESLKGISYQTHDLFMGDYLQKIVWDAFHRTRDVWGKKPRLLIIFEYWFLNTSRMSALTLLKTLGVEIFVVAYRKLENVEEMASYPTETHVFHWQQYRDPNAMLSELALSVCRSLEGHRHKKSSVGDVRLVNGSGLCNGIVEVTLNNSPRRVCIWGYDSREAAVTCRQVGCGPLMKMQENLAEPGAEVPMVEKIHCSGGEADLSKCSVSLWREQPCFLSVSAGLVCAQSPPSGIQLVGGSSVCSGKVRVNYGGSWGSICADEWGRLEEVVVCRQMGCGPAIDTAEWKMPSSLSRSSGNVLEAVYCHGHESQLSECGSVSATSKTCYIPEAEVLCSQSVISQVALVNGPTGCSGRVEVYYKGKWGTVCDETWDLADANVVCKELGCGSATEAPKAARFHPGDGPIWLEKVFCNGNEAHLSECGAVTSRRGVCDHSQDAGVICSGPEPQP
uniref:SRCR domain-containing protein n=1 Tax=Xenopus tropicalis TaxID=8364 RepID=A0A803JPV6_XENTR